MATGTTESTHLPWSDIVELKILHSQHYPATGSRYAQTTDRGSSTDRNLISEIRSDLDTMNNTDTDNPVVNMDSRREKLMSMYDL